MNQGLTPCDRRVDSYFAMKVYDKGKEVTWAPTNANGYFTGDSMPLKAAFAQSINSIAVKLGQECGINRIVQTAHAMGIQSKLDPTPSLPLGSSDVNLLEAGQRLLYGSQRRKNASACTGDPHSGPRRQ